jgi:hypothetical protein
MRIPRDNGIGISALAGAAGLVLCGVGAFVNLRIALAAWLTAALILIGLPLGAMTLLMIHGLTGGRWGEAMKPPLRATVTTLPLTLLFLLPLLLRLDLVFPWAVPDAALPEVVQAKLAYLNVPFFLARFAACFVVWLGLAFFILRWTDPELRRSNTRGFALGLIIHAAAVTLFSTDWMLSLDPEFTSTIYAMLEASAEVVGAAALALLVLAATRSIEVLPGGEGDAVLGEDVANMLFGFMLTWAYLAFMQWIVVWAGDLPNDIGWYLRRVSGGWRILLWLAILLQFVLPFAAFLARSVKRSHRGLLWLAVIVLAGHVLETAWRIRPALTEPHFSLAWLELAAPVAAGCLWAAMFVIALREPRRLFFWQEKKAHG